MDIVPTSRKNFCLPPPGARCAKVLTAELVGLRIVNEVRSACFGPRRGAETSLGLDKADDAVEAFALHEIGHDKRPSAAHAPGVGFHFFQRCADMRREVDLVDDEK